MKPDLRRLDLPLDAAGSRDQNLAPRSVLAGVTQGNLVVLADAEGQGLVHLTAEVSGQRLQCGNVLDLQVLLADVVVLHRVVIELLQERLEDVGDA